MNDAESSKAKVDVSATATGVFKNNAPSIKASIFFIVVLLPKNSIVYSLTVNCGENMAKMNFLTFFLHQIEF